MSRTRTNLISLGVGLAAATVGAAVGLAAERLTVGRPLIRRFPQPDDEPGIGSIRDVPVAVIADDGITLHAEVDEADRAVPGDVTVVFSHGYSNTLDAWHFQRQALLGRVRCVWWDQRGHGRSERGADGVVSIEQLGRDLHAVIAATAPTGPLVLVGHSMGGMATMSYAAQFTPDVRARVCGVGLVATSAGGLGKADLGLARFGQLLTRLAPRALTLLSRQPGLVERTRRIGSDLEEVIVKRWSFGGDVEDSLIDFTARMIAATRIEVVTEFMPAITAVDVQEGLFILRNLESLVIHGDKDLMIPPEHSEALAAVLTRSEHVIVRDAGHLVHLEHPEVVNPHVAALIGRARAGLGLTLGTPPTRPVRGLSRRPSEEVTR